MTMRHHFAERALKKAPFNPCILRMGNDGFLETEVSDRRSLPCDARAGHSDQ